MSSHREAPEISKDPVADNADVYAFVSPDDPSTVTLISNFVPLQDPPGGPNFFEFGDDVMYSIYIDNNGDGVPEISYVFRFETKLRDPNTFLYNTGPITSLQDTTWNKRQFYSVTRVEGHDTTAYGTAAAAVKKGHKHAHKPKLHTKVLGQGLACPPCNIGPRSTPDYNALGEAAVHGLPGGGKVFAGQRTDGFYVDLGAIFDLADLRPFQEAHLIPSAKSMGVDATKMLNIHTIALQIPISQLTSNGKVPTDATSPASVIGVWSAASRRKVRMIDKKNDERSESGPWVQVSRLGNPLVNEVVIPLGIKDRWNALYPAEEKTFKGHFEQPELSKLLPVLYPKVFPNLEKLSKPRADLVAILLTGLPTGVVPGFQNYSGKVLADQLHLNLAVPPTTSNPNRFGLLGNDVAGFPNGRRVFDDVVSIELRAFAGVTYALVDKTFTPDAAAGLLTEGIEPAPNRYQATFPYLAPPQSGFDVPAS